MSSAMHTYRMKRSCLHNVRIQISEKDCKKEIPEGLVMPRSLMEMADIAPFEQIIVTKIGGDNWVNRMYSFVVPGSTDHVEARGAVAHLLNEGDLCCVITGTYFDQQQYQHYLENRLEVPIIDVRLYPDDGRMTNDLASAKTVLEANGKSVRVPALNATVVARRAQLPRVMLSNLLAGLQVEVVERRGCIEMSAELPAEYMRLAGFCKNQSIFVYNASRGGTSAESYVVPSEIQKKIAISGALSAVADEGDVISEAAYIITTGDHRPIIHNVLTSRKSVKSMLS